MRLIDLVPSDGIAVRTRQKLLHTLNRWQRLGGCADAESVTTEMMAAVRAAGVASKLAPKTIETTISDVITLLGYGGLTVSAGRRLRVSTQCRPVPELAAVERLYLLSDQWHYPTRLRSGEHFETVSQELQRQWLRAFIVLGLWTGLRLQDLLHLTWDSVTPDRIVWRASKTSREHRFPMCSVVAAHIEPLRALGRETVLGCNSSNTTLLRDQLHEVMPVATVTPQALRRASITTWATVSPEAGRIVHGTGLGVLRHYYDCEQILRACCDRFPWPAAMLPADQRDVRQRLTSETESVLARLSPERLADVLRVARAFAG